MLLNKTVLLNVDFKELDPIFNDINLLDILKLYFNEKINITVDYDKVMINGTRLFGSNYLEKVNFLDLYNDDICFSHQFCDYETFTVFKILREKTHAIFRNSINENFETVFHAIEMISCGSKLSFTTKHYIHEYTNPNYDCIYRFKDEYKKLNEGFAEIADIEPNW